MSGWRNRLREPRTWVLISLGFITLVLLVWFSRALGPVLAAAVIAYLLDGLVLRLEKLKVPRILAVALVLLGTVLLMGLIVFTLLPTVVEQLNQLANQIGPLLTQFEAWLVKMEQTYPSYFPGESVQEFVGRLSIQVENQLGRLITVLLAWAGGTFTGTVNAVIVAFLTFFILKDKEIIWAYLVRVVPFLGHPAFQRVANDIDRQMGRFIKGKFLVVFVLFIFSTLVYLVIGLNYFLLLGIMTGLSTFIPYIGAIVVTIPVVATGLLQWGSFTAGVLTLLAYTGVQAVDANFLTPVLIGRETNIHPVAIIGAILICGSLWGFWGVFFAVPVAVVVKSILDQVYFGSMDAPRAAVDTGDGGA